MSAELSFSDFMAIQKRQWREDTRRRRSERTLKLFRFVILFDVSVFIIVSAYFVVRGWFGIVTELL